MSLYETLNNKGIVHMDMDTFFVSVERLSNPDLKDKPILVGGLSDRAVVASCSYETRRFGIHSGMPMKQARRLCPEARIIRGDMESYSKYSKIVTQIIAEKAPAYEKASIDEHYIDVSGMDKFHGTFKWTKELREKIIRETNLPISCGLSNGKCISKMATGEAKPNGIKQVLPSDLKEFLNPLPIRKIPMLGPKACQKLISMGVTNIGTLGQIPLPYLEKLLGKAGKLIWERANGIDETPVIAYSERKSISEEMTFNVDTTDLSVLHLIITRMGEKLGYNLRNQNKIAGCITLKIRYSNFDTHTRQTTIPYTASDHVIINSAKSLFKKLYDKRLLIRLVGLKVSHLIYGHTQINLFEDSVEMMDLYQSLDKIKNRFGETSVMKASGFFESTTRKLRSY